LIFLANAREVSIPPQLNKDPFEAFEFFEKQEAQNEDLALTFSHQIINSTFFNFSNPGNVIQSSQTKTQKPEQKESVINNTQNGVRAQPSGTSLVRKPSIQKCNSDQPSTQRKELTVQENNQFVKPSIYQQEANRANQQQQIQPDLIEEKFYGEKSDKIEQPQNLMDLSINPQPKMNQNLMNQNPNFLVQRQMQMAMQMQAQQNFRSQGQYGMFNSHGNAYMMRQQGNIPNIINGQIFPQQFNSNFNNQMKLNNFSNQNMGQVQQTPNFALGQGSFNLGAQNQPISNLPPNMIQNLPNQANSVINMQNGAMGGNYIHPHILQMHNNFAQNNPQNQPMQNVQKQSEIKIESQNLQLNQQALIQNQENKNIHQAQEKKIYEQSNKINESEPIKKEINQNKNNEDINLNKRQNLGGEIDEYDLLFNKPIEAIEETKSEVHFTASGEFGGWDSVFDVGNNFGIQNQAEQERKRKEEEAKIKEKNISLTNTSLTSSNIRKFIFQEFSKSKIEIKIKKDLIN